MLASRDVKWVITSHSERRDGYGDLDDAAQQASRGIEAAAGVALLWRNFGVRESGTHFDWVQRQLSHALEGLFKLPWMGWSSRTNPFGPLEPVKLQMRHRPKKCMRLFDWLTGRFDATTAQNCRILYGGSEPSNADELCSTRR